MAASMGRWLLFLVELLGFLTEATSGLDWG